MKISISNPSEISLNSSKKLWSPLIQDSLVYSNQEGNFPDSTLKKWLSTQNNESLKIELSSSFNLSLNQINLIVNWLNSSLLQK